MLQFPHCEYNECWMPQSINQSLYRITATTTECDLCNKNGKCILDDSSVVRCECRPWFAGRNCQINLKLLLIVGCVSVILMIVIACGVSCFCCRDRNAAKDNIPCEYHEKLMEKEIKMELFYHFSARIALLFLIWIIKRFLAIFLQRLMEPLCQECQRIWVVNKDSWWIHMLENSR